MAARRYIKLTGTELGDFLKGTKKHDYIDAGAGDDTILSGAIRVGQGQNVDLVTLELYNGGNGAVYHTASLADYDVSSSADGFDFYVIDDIQLQDGSPDGMALAYDGTVIEFLSYEGTFSASNGTAEGLTAYDIGVSEPEFGLAGYSLQRNSDGTWFDPSPETRGESNLTEDLLLG